MTRRPLVLLAAIAAPCLARAQEPTRLPTVVTTATPDKPGARKLVGFVGDTLAVPIEGAEISIPALQKRVFSRADGKFYFDSIPKGKYSIRAKKLGFAPQIRTLKVESDGGAGAFGLVPLPYTLDPMVTTAERAGLSGIVGDTSYTAIADAEVRVLGRAKWARTDSTGAFHIPVEPGSYMVSFRRPGYEYRLVGVIVPPDSGKRITVTLPPLTRKRPNQEAHNVDDFAERLAWRSGQVSRVYTRADLERMRVEWPYEVVRQAWNNLGNIGEVSRDCRAALNGGPAFTELGRLTVDDIESIEIYVGRQIAESTTPPGVLARPGNSAPSARRIPVSNYERTWIMNGARLCPTLYVWTRNGAP